MARRENLTRDEALTRSASVAVVAYEVLLDLRTGDETFLSESTIRFEVTGDEPLFVDCSARRVTTVELDGSPLGDDVVEPTRIQLPALTPGAHTLRVVAEMEYQHTGSGMHHFRDPTDGEVYLHSQFEPFDAHLVFACFDQPDLKARFRFGVDAPAGWVVVSNAPVEQRPAEGQEGRWVFENTDLLSTYVTAIIAGAYVSVHDQHGDVPLGIYVRRSLAEHLDADELFELTRQGLDWYADAFAMAYPFGKYDQLFVPEFSAGAMENPGCVTFTETYIFRSRVTDALRERRAETLLHEMAHMWFGDLVTMRWWDDLWLNESFATFMALLSQAEATRFRNAWVTFLDHEKAWAKYQDQLPTTHPIAADMVDIESVHQNFDGITYAKGAAVLRQLVAWVGQDHFLEGCRRYFAAHAYGNAELADFLSSLEEASGRDLDAWKDAWLRTTGLNTLSASVSIDDEGRYQQVMIEQSGENQPTRPHRVAVGVYDLTDAGLVRRVRRELDIRDASTTVPELSGIAAGDALLVNDDDLAYVKVLLDERTTATVTEHLARFVEPLPRALVWSTTWDMLRDGDLPARRYVELVLNNMAAESEIGVLQRLQGRALAAVERYGDPERADSQRARLADHAREQLDHAAPGSDHQLAWVRFWASTARGGQLDEVRQVVEGELTFPGLDLDTELRWHLVTCLAAAGAVEPEIIDATLEDDPTDLGQRHAATAHAARPDPAAKQATWDRLIGEPGLTHTMARQLWGGFQRLDQPELIAPYVEPYFASLGDVFANRPLDWAIEFAQGMYPHAAVSENLLTRTERYLTRDDVPGPLRRALLEEGDTLARTLRARATDRDA